MNQPATQDAEMRAREVLAEHVAPSWREGIISGQNSDWGHIRPSEAIRAILAYASTARQIDGGAVREAAQALVDRFPTDMPDYSPAADEVAALRTALATHSTAGADYVLDYERAYFERGFIAAAAWALTKSADTRLSDAVIDHAWAHRDEGMDTGDILPVRLAAAPTPDSAPTIPAGRAVYVASRASLPARGEMWRALRAEGVPINSTWIDEDGPKASRDLGDLWDRIRREVTSAERLVLYVEPDDFPLKGALIEVGIALAAKVPVYVVAPGIELDPRNSRPLGSWVKSPLVRFAPDVRTALAYTPVAQPLADQPIGGVREAQIREAKWLSSQTLKTPATTMSRKLGTAGWPTPPRKSPLPYAPPPIPRMIIWRRVMMTNVTDASASQTGLSPSVEPASSLAGSAASIPSAFIPGRYPYTYSADFIRQMMGGTKLSRSEAANLLTSFASVLRFDRTLAACDFADAYLMKWHPETVAQAMEARRAATGTGAVHESAVPEECAQGDAA